MKELKAEELLNIINEIELIDIREKDEYDIIHFKNSKLIPMGEILNRLDEIDWNKKVLVFCRTGSRSRYIAQQLDLHGKDVYDLLGGIKACYNDNNYSSFLEMNGEEENYF